LRFRLTPRDTSFFDLLARSGGKLVETADLLAELVTAAPGRRPGFAEQITALEHEGDEITHEIMRRLNSTFVTPFDREDISGLAGAMDDCLDFMEEASDLIVLYQITDLPAGVIQQVTVLRQQAELTAQVMPRLRSTRGLEPYWVEINRLEDTADRAFRSMLARMFDEVDDAVTLLKLREVVQVLEEAADAFETVANRVETIAVKES
jgi:predicted phosphate transport protein (TIGR00153 family)